MKVILSIKPQFAEKIFDGTKLFEFRRTLFKDSSVKSVLVYASAPISKIIGEFEIEEIIFREVDSLWKKTKEYAGISEEYYHSYFSGKKNGYAIKIKSTNRFKEDKCIKRDYGLMPPQSFAYLR